MPSSLGGFFYKLSTHFFISMLSFYKYQGTGNDFILIDNRLQHFSKEASLIEKLCDRRFGVGADGLICLENSEDSQYDFRMVYFNADGFEGSMCGNGGRCIVRFAHDLGIIQEKTTFIAVDGPHEAQVTVENIHLKMSDVSKVEQYDAYDFLNTGSPHYVALQNDLDSLDVTSVGSSIRYSPEWVEKGGTNVNFMEVISTNHLYVRTYERGVEDETYSCGTGVTACAISSSLRFNWVSPIAIKTKGGNLQISFQQDISEKLFTQIYLIGPAQRVFIGQLEEKTLF